MEKQYELFKVWLDCKEHHGPFMVYYRLDKDTGNVERPSSDFKQDPELISEECQFKSGNSFGKGYDRGHLVPANHMDSSEQAMDESFYITNMLPQEASFNRHGAWRKTEQISECYREISPLKIWAGVVWGTDKSNDLFVESHGVETPDYWWKLIYREDKNEYEAWYFPNSAEASREKIDSFKVSVDELKQKLDYVPDFGIPGAKQGEFKVEGNSRELVCEGVKVSGN